MTYLKKRELSNPYGMSDVLTENLVLIYAPERIHYTYIIEHIFAGSKGITVV